MRKPNFRLTSVSQSRRWYAGNVHRKQRRGLSFLEILASASILAILIAFFATLSVRIHRLAKDVEKDQTTIHEVANVLEVEIAKQTQFKKSPEQLPPQSTSSASSTPDADTSKNTDDLPTSSLLATLWPRGRLVLQRSQDSLGERLTISFFKNSEQLDALPITLTGWVPENSDNSNDNGETSDAARATEPPTGVTP